MRISFITQIGLALGAGVLCLATIGYTSFLGVSEVAETAHLEARTQNVLANLQELRSLFHNAVSSHRLYLLTGDADRSASLEPQRERLFLELFHLRALTVDSPTQRPRLDAVEALLREELARFEAAAALRRLQGVEPVIRMMAAPEGQDHGGEITALLDQFGAEETRRLHQREEQTRGRQQAAGATVAAGAGLGMVLVLWSLVVIRRYHVQRDAAEAALSRARERLELALEGSGLALWDADVPSGRVYLDGRWTEMLGGPRSETQTTARELLDLAHPEDREPLQQLAREVLQGRREEYRVEHRVLARNGEWRWILSRGRVAERDRRGRALRMAGTNGDITERKRVDEALRASEAQLRLVTDNVPAMIAYLDENELCRFANRNYAAMFGREVPEVVGQHLRSIAGPDNYRIIEPHIHRALAGETVRYERPHHNSEGRLELEVVLVPHRDASGEVRGIYVMISDITERRAVDRMKGEFVSMVSHELRTPLTSLVGALGLLNGGAAGPLSSEAGPLLDIAARNAERLTALVDDILNLEKLEGGMMRFAPRAVDLAELLRLMLEANRPYALQFGVEFELAPVPAGARVLADPDRIAQVLANLLSNAAKFSPRGAKVEVSGEMRDRWARVSVRDHGPG
ncbi:MAG TPA: PAS domain-containing protein, partial [Burkholderiales bacterium]|nr:PAS domain-containing protein [Burkholderiales bacterium]